MKGIRKKIIGIFLAAVMCISVIPSAAFAEDAPVADSTERVSAAGEDMPDGAEKTEETDISDAGGDLGNIIISKGDLKELDSAFGVSHHKHGADSADIVEFPEAPDLPEEPENLADGEVLDEIYGQPEDTMSTAEYQELQALSLDAPVVQAAEYEIPKEQLNGPTITVYINGEPYTGGDLTVQKEDNFSYSIEWSPNLPSGHMTWGEGSWFEAELFTIPGLSLSSSVNIPLVINGIKVGAYSLIYNSTTGKMMYRVVFNQYIQYFTPESIRAFLRGSGKFVKEFENTAIAAGVYGGFLTVEPKPAQPSVPAVPSGTAWQPSKAPTFNDRTYPFGKGMKWNNAKFTDVVPQIEWRIVFLEQLQKTQQAYLSSKELSKSEEYLIVEDTLDKNQQFYFPKEKKYDNQAPFYLELPVMIPGTGYIVNHTSGTDVSYPSYTGNGNLDPVITGKAFRQIDGSNAKDAAAVKAVQDEVRETPLRWTVTTDPSTKQQTLLINTGKLGTTDSREGVTWNLSTAPQKAVTLLQSKIKECDKAIAAIQNGEDSPIALIRSRANTLYNLLDKAVNLPANAGQKETLAAAVAAWREDFETCRGFESIDNQKPLADTDSLPKESLITALANCVTDASGTKLANTVAYKNYLISLRNIRADQKTYLENLSKYGADWQAAKEKYQSALNFYQDRRVYGFVVKVRTQSINTSATDYDNTASVSLSQKKWETDNTQHITFSSGITGNYALGSFVLQKADAYYNEAGKTDVQNIKTVENDNAGLAGAKFQVYCGIEGNENGESLTDAYLAYFLDKDASENGDTYRYTHTGKATDIPLKGELSTLTVDTDGKAKGKLILSNIVAHAHYLVETEAPAGYYLDTTPIRVDNVDTEVNYKLVPNVSRSVLLYKKDSYSGNPVEGAEFALYRKDGETETPITGFAAKNVNGHQTYWKTANGTDKLLTNEDGALCIHGLDAGEYILREVKPAAGYVTPDPVPEYKFTLTEKLPTDISDTTKYDADGHRLLNTAEKPLENDPDVATLTLTKKNLKQDALENAGFALFRFTGTEKQWRELREARGIVDAQHWWEAVSQNGADGKYFKTTNTIEKDVSLPGTTEIVDAILTGEDGKLTLTDIPFGHYCVFEVKTSDGTYQRDNRSFYFNVTGTTVNTSVQLYTDPQENEQLEENTLINYHRQAKLALVKYDKAKGAPEINGGKIGNGWQYTDTILKEGKGLAGATYKLFMYQGDTTSKLHPDPAQLATTTILPPNANYDACLAVGTTDENGVLDVTEMAGINGAKLTTGLNPGEYYMVEVEAREGYLLDQTPIRFPLDERVFPENEDALAGLVLAAGNEKKDYGIRLQKVDAETSAPLAGAEFSVTQNGTTLSFVKDADGTYRKAAANAANAVTTVVTDENGRLTLVGLEKETTYTLTETKAPQGYAVAAPVSIKTPADVADAALEGTVLFPKEITQVADARLTRRGNAA